MTETLAIITGLALIIGPIYRVGEKLALASLAWKAWWGTINSVWAASDSSMKLHTNLAQ